MKQTKIVIIDHDPNVIASILAVLSAEADVFPQGILTSKKQGYYDLVAQTVAIEPDIVLLPEHLTEHLVATEFLTSLNGEFHREMPAPGNPRVISTSRDMSPQFTRLVGGFFEGRQQIVASRDPAEWPAVAQHLVEVVRYAIDRLRAQP